MNERKCGKVSFGTEKDALFYIDKLQRTSERELVPIRAYLCQYCTNWHLTKVVDKTTGNIIDGLNKRILELKQEIWKLKAKK